MGQWTGDWEVKVRIPANTLLHHNFGQVVYIPVHHASEIKTHKCYMNYAVLIWIIYYNRFVLHHSLNWCSIWRFKLFVDSEINW